MSKKLTIVKIVSHDGNPTAEDMEKWHEIFCDHSMTIEDAAKTGEVKIECMDLPEHNHYNFLIRFNNAESHIPSLAELEEIRYVFEEAKKDPEPVVFIHPDVLIEIIDRQPN